MLIDARTLSKNTLIKTDVCIIGAGAAGITLAREFIGQPFRVCLLESGGLEYEADTQSLARGQSVGNPYFPLESARLRYFGGTTNHWGGASRPLDDIDFKQRSWLPHSGWPFDRPHLLPFYERAHNVLQIAGPFAYGGKEWESADRPRAAFSGDTLTSAVLQQSPPTRFGQVYRDEIARAPNVDIYLHANVLEIQTNELARSVTRLRVTSLERNDFFVSARMFVLATGGIENPRLLLLSNRTNQQGLGNDHGLVGRFFMEHPNTGYKAGIIAPTGFPTGFYEGRERGLVEIAHGGRSWKSTYWGFLTPSEQTLRREKLLNCGIAVQEVPTEHESPGVESARRIKDSLRGGKWPEDFGRHVGNVASDFGSVAFLGCKKLTGQKPPAMIEIQYWSEPFPNPESRVQLSKERDALGQHRVMLDWRLTDHDKRNMRRTLEILASELGRSGLGRLGVNPTVWGDDWRSLFYGSWHHIGTTRMHKDPKQGVVDPNCRVHGVSNLFIAGSSVFPTAGHANPTITIVALALRLADHIKQKMG